MKFCLLVLGISFVNGVQLEMNEMQETTMEIMNTYAESLANAIEAIDAGTSTPSQNLTWLVSLSEMWVRETMEPESVVFSQQG